MPISQQILAAWLRNQIAPVLRQQGFAGSGQDYHRRIGRNWAAINFQRDRYSTADQVRFTVNIGTASAAVIAAAHGDPEVPPREVLCHWRDRLGSLLPQHEDTWWTIRAVDDDRRMARLADEVGGALTNFALPELERMAADEAILAVHLTETSFAELSPFSMDIVGPILLETGPKELFQRYMAALDSIQRLPDLYEIWAEYPPAMGPARTAKALEKLSSKAFEPRSAALHNLAFAAPTAEVVGAVRAALDDPDPYIRYAAAFAAGRVGDERFVPRLVQIIEQDPRATACSAAVAALRLVERLPDADLPGIRKAIAARHVTAVGHDRPQLGYVLRQLDAMTAKQAGH